MRLLPLIFGVALANFGFAPAQQLPADVGQLLVGIAPDWDSDQARMWCFNRDRNGAWELAFAEPTPILLGRSGLAWGLGVFPNPPSQIPLKREGDGKTPAGIFAIGKIYGYPEKLPAGASFPYRQVGKYDAWVDDPENPLYNQHFIAKPGQEPAWFDSQRVRLGDPAYKYKIEIRHNSDPPTPGSGSAIFFHIRRGPDRPTSGCTTMAESELVKVMTWLRAEKKPHYVILPKAEYDQLQGGWGLPAFR